MHPKGKLLKTLFHILRQRGVLVTHDSFGIGQENGWDPRDSEGRYNLKVMIETRGAVGMTPRIWRPTSLPTERMAQSRHQS